MRVLGIETSCDETAVAVYDDKQGLLSHEIYSQIKLHAQYGGVVPELASRDHIKKLLPLVKVALEKSHSSKNDIDGIAFTAGPGLAGALLVGATFGRSLAYAWSKPALSVHHLDAHLLAPMLEENAPSLPLLALLVSGGHSLLVEANEHGRYKILGETLDDAAGEAFDKVAKLLGLPYPGGPALAKLAEMGTPNKYHLPRPMTDKPGLDFSFSGLKTAVLHLWRYELNENPDEKANVARAFEDAVVETLLIKCKRALKQTGLNTLVIAGGVGANKKLRAQLKEYAIKNNTAMFFPRPEFCTDNGAMVAFAGLQQLKNNKITDSLAIKTYPRWDLEG